ncbi:MAG TPA: hypothetical protein VEU51_01945 [Candidatus Acidoferrales bacterium]|nr:hypothetical protein [Candidatus Acidoferrales bacterium]
MLDIHHATRRVLFGDFQNQIANRDSRADAVSQIDTVDFEIGPAHRPRNFEPEVAAGVSPSLCADHSYLAARLYPAAVTLDPGVRGNQRLIDSLHRNARLRSPCDSQQSAGRLSPFAFHGS